MFLEIAVRADDGKNICYTRKKRKQFVGPYCPYGGFIHKRINCIVGKYDACHEAAVPYTAMMCATIPKIGDGVEPVFQNIDFLKPELTCYVLLVLIGLESMKKSAQGCERHYFQRHPTWRHRWLMVLCLVMLDKILVATVNIGFYMTEQIINRITIKAFIIIPMAVMRGFGIDLHNFGAYRYFDFFNSIENQGAQPAVKTIQIYKVLEKQIAPQKAVIRAFLVVLERIGVCPQTIVTDIEKVSLSLAFIIEKEASFL